MAHRNVALAAVFDSLFSYSQLHCANQGSAELGGLVREHSVCNRCGGGVSVPGRPGVRSISLNHSSPTEPLGDRPLAAFGTDRDALGAVFLDRVALFVVGKFSCRG